VEQQQPQRTHAAGEVATALQQSLRLAVELLSPHWGDLQKSVGTSARVEVDGIALSIVVGPVLELAKCSLFANPPKRALDESGLPVTTRPKVKQVYAAVRGIRELPGGSSRLVRRRHVLAKLEEMTGNTESVHTVAHALAELVRNGWLTNNRRIGYLLANRATSEKAQSSPPSS
jgi:hypothetical protein